MKLERDTKQKIREHALRDKPNECCGLIVSDGEKTFVYEGHNNSRDPTHHFSLSPLDYVKASKLGKITAVYHSHLKGCNLSDADKWTSQSHEITYVLYCLEDNSIIQYDPSFEFIHYAGRDFKWMTSDCFSLLRDFYQKELDISIRDYPRGQDWQKEYGNLFDKFFEKENFKEVKNLKKYDAILYKSRKKGFSVHCAVYLGDGLILHQPRGSASRIDECTRYKNIINKIVRHESL